MNTLATTHPPARFHGGMHYVHPVMPQRAYFQMAASTSFQASGESVSQKDNSSSAIEATPPATPKESGIYLYSNQLRYHASNATENNLKRFGHLYPAQFRQKCESLQSNGKIKADYLECQQRAPETYTAELNLHNKLPNGIQKIVRVQNPGYVVCSPTSECPAVDARSPTRQFESSARIKPESYHAYQKGHRLGHENEYLSEERVVYLKPSGYQTQPTSIPPMAMSAPVHVSFSGIQPSNINQSGPRYPVNIQNPRVPYTAEEPKHYAHGTWPNLAPVPHGVIADPGPNGIYTPFKVPPNSIHSYSKASPNSVSEKLDSGVNSVRCQPSNVAVQNGVQPTLPFSHSEVPSVHHFSGGNNNLPTRQMTPDFHSASTFIIHASTAVASNGVHSTVPAASYVNPYRPEDNDSLSRPEYQKDPNSTQYHGFREPPKCTTAALAVHNMNTVPTNAHLVTHPPAPRQLPVFTPAELIESHSRKAHFPVRVLYAPPQADGASCVTAPNSCHTGDVNGHWRPADCYNTSEVRQLVSTDVNQSFQTKGTAHYTSGYANVSSQVNASEGLNKAIPIQYPYQPASEGFCRPVGGEISALNHCIDSMSSLHQKTLAYSKSNVLMVAPPGRPNYAALTKSQPAIAQVSTASNSHFVIMNGHDVHRESNYISHNETSGFHKMVHLQEAEKSQDGPNSVVNNSWIVTKQQLHHNSGDSHGRSSGCSHNIAGYAASCHAGMSYPTILPRTPIECDNSIATKEPRCYISVDSKPQVEKEKEQPSFSHTPRSLPELTQPHEGKMPCIDNQQPDNKLAKLTNFVVGVETKIHDNYKKNYEKNKSKGSEKKDLQIVGVSTTQNPCDGPVYTRSNSSGSESEDPFCMIRLERVYYSANAIPSQSSSMSAVQDSAIGERRQLTGLSDDSSKQDNFVAFGNKTGKDLSAVKKVRKTANVSVAHSVKRKADVSNTKQDGTRSVKRKKMEQTKQKVPPRGTMNKDLAKVKASVGILSTKNVIVQLDGKNQTFLEDMKQVSKKKDNGTLIRERVRKHCTRKMRINS